MIYRIEKCAGNGKPIIQIQLDNGAWLCQHKATTEQDEQAVKEFINEKQKNQD